MLTVSTAPATGATAPQWQAPLSNGHYCGPTVGGDEVYVRSACGEGCSPADNAVQAFPTSCSSPCRARWYGPAGVGEAFPAAKNGVVYVPSDSLPGVYAFPAHCGTGGAPCAPLWRGVTSGAPLVLTSPAVGDGLIALHVRSSSGIETFGVGCGTGGSVCSPRWHADVPPCRTPRPASRKTRSSSAAAIACTHSGVVCKR